MNKRQVIKELGEVIKAYGEQKIFADTHGVQPAVVSKALAGKFNELPPSILNALRLEKVVTVSYRRKK